MLQLDNDLKNYNLPTIYFSMENIINDSEYVISNLNRFIGSNITINSFNELFSSKLVRSHNELKMSRISDSKIRNLYLYLEGKHV